MAFMHAYKFTHFSDANTTRTNDPDLLSIGEKTKALFLGISNPRPTNEDLPTLPFKTVTIDNSLEGWYMQSRAHNGTVIMFHGYASKKSTLLVRSYELLNMGYSVLLIDFTGSGGSPGNSTSIGFHESHQVKACYNYLKSHGETNIFLFGVSMGSAAILKSLYDDDYQPQGIILECPFGSLYQTTCERFNNMGVPSFPMAGMLVFWGGVQNNFWAFGHNPATYAGKVKCPTLIIYGEQDDRVSRQEIDQIYNNLAGRKHLRLYPDAGHNDLFSDTWIHDVSNFITRYSSKE